MEETATGKTDRMIEPVAQWSIEPALSSRKESENISGIACAMRDGDRWSGLMMSDEMRYARVVRLDRDQRTIVPRSKIALLPPVLDGEEVPETDAEGVDFDDGRYYLIGSHGVSKRAGLVQAARYFAYRFKVDPDSGKPDFDHDRDDPAPQIKRTDKLGAIIAATAPLDSFIHCALQDNGVNIEALAVRDGSLYAGFRAPVTDGYGLVLRVPVAELFDNTRPEAVPRRLFRIRLRERCGVRDLAKVQGGFLVLTGQALPAGEEDVERQPAELYLWDGESDDDPTRLGRLGGVAPGGKPEALLVLDETKNEYRLLVLCDGVPGGNPTEYVVPKRSR